MLIAWIGLSWVIVALVAAPAVGIWLRRASQNYPRPSAFEIVNRINAERAREMRGTPDEFDDWYGGDDCEAMTTELPARRSQFTVSSTPTTYRSSMLSFGGTSTP